MYYLVFPFSIVGRLELMCRERESAAKYLVCTLLDPPTSQERTYRFLGGNYSWNVIFRTLEKIQGVKWTVTFKSVEEARESQRRVRTPNVCFENSMLIVG
jgi:hypothetical protein